MSLSTRTRFAVAVDLCVFSADLVRPSLDVLLVRRGQPPFEREWALPGGFVEEGETLEAAAARELEEETGVADAPIA